MPPASPDARASIDTVLEPLREETERVDHELASNHAFLEERRSRGVDEETRDLLTRAAASPSAPDSIRRLARQVAAGELTWDAVFAHRAGPDGMAFLSEAFSTAQEHFARARVPPVAVPHDALDVGIDPDEVAADIGRTRAEARVAHDEVFRP